MVSTPRFLGISVRNQLTILSNLLQIIRKIHECRNAVWSDLGSLSRLSRLSLKHCWWSTGTRLAMSVGRSVRNILLFLRLQVVLALPLHHYPCSADRNRNVVESAKAVIVVRFRLMSCSSSGRTLSCTISEEIICTRVKGIGLDA